MLRLSLFLAIITTTSSCFKTAEDIRRDKLVDQMDRRLNQSSKLVAELTQKVDELQGRLDSKFGALEEKDYVNKTKEEEEAKNIEQMRTQMRALEGELQKSQKKTATIEGKLNKQNKYINKVNVALGDIAGPTATSSNAKLKEAHTAFEKGKNQTATKLYNEVLTEGKINNAQKNHVFFNLGLMSYRAKKYNQALPYFSKIYTRYPRSSLSPRSLLYIARSFKGQSKKDEAKAAYTEVKKKYPKSKSAKSAIKELSQL